jgi:hypothetical protein
LIDWKPYLESICKKYAQWWATYIITDVVSKKEGRVRTLAGIVEPKQIVFYADEDGNEPFPVWLAGVSNPCEI